MCWIISSVTSASENDCFMAQRKMKCACRAGKPWEGEAPAEPDDSVQSSQSPPWEGEAPAEPRRQCSVIAKSPLGRTRLLPSRTTVFSHPKVPPWEGEAPAEPRRSAACRTVRLSGGFALPKDATPTPCQRQKTLTPEPPPFFGVVAVLRGPLFVNTCGHAIGRCAQDFALILFHEVLRQDRQRRYSNWPCQPSLRCRVL
ncbi:MAG: hypothetical protein RIT02_1231 [Planctomycetota bacterium]